MWTTIGKYLTQDCEGTRKSLYSITTNYKKDNDVTYAVNEKDGNMILEPEKIADRWTEYFEDLLNVEVEVEHSEQEEGQQQHRRVKGHRGGKVEKLAARIFIRKRNHRPSVDFENNFRKKVEMEYKRTHCLHWPRKRF